METIDAIALTIKNIRECEKLLKESKAILLGCGYILDNEKLYELLKEVENNENDNK